MKYPRCEHIKKADDVTNTVYCCDQCASKIMESLPTDKQQLKAEIAALETMLLEAIKSGNFKIVSRVHDRMRQLSAI